MQRDLLQRQQRQNLGTGIFDVGEYIVDAIADRVEARLIKSSQRK